MQALDYLLPQPAFDLSAEKQAAFDTLIDATPPGACVEYRLAYPRWQFLSYLCRSRELVLHGSQNPAITTVLPRRAQDVYEFNAREAIYATTDGIWAIFFAIIDRAHHSPLSLFNSCLKIRIANQGVLGPLYFFSITHTALLRQPWCEGAVYILPRGGFDQEPPRPWPGAELIAPHWISAAPAYPIARLIVGPQDFPFLSNIHGHDDMKLSEQAAANPDGFPWPEALVV